MNNILLFESFLDAQYAPLYHWTDQMCAILTTDKLKSRINMLDTYGSSNPKINHTNNEFNTDKSISFTREINFSFPGGHDVRLVINSDLLRRDFQLQPFDAYSSPSKYNPLRPNSKSNPKYRDAYGDRSGTSKSSVEFEEVILNRDVVSLHRYLIGIDFPEGYKLDEMNEDALRRFMGKNGSLNLRMFKHERLWQTFPIEIETLLYI